jgi:hypothetical protein
LLKTLSNQLEENSMSSTNIKRFRLVSIFIIALMVVGAITVAVPVQTVSAASGEPPATETQEQAGPAQRTVFLERAYRMVVRFSEHVGKDYERIPKIVERTENLIARLEENGLDPAPIPTALSEFQVEAIANQPEFTEALAILAAHAGFDDEGKVTDRGEAAKTINQARVALEKAHRGFHDALQDLRLVLQEYREDHPLPTLEKPLP